MTMDSNNTDNNTSNGATKKNCWNVSTSKVSFASILAEEEEEQKNPKQVKHVTFADHDNHDDDDFQKALKESMLYPTTREEDDLELAIRLSLQDQQPSQQQQQQQQQQDEEVQLKMSHIPNTENDEAIARQWMLKDDNAYDYNDTSSSSMNDDKYNESLALAMYLQQMDRTNYDIEQKQQQRKGQGNVQSVYADEFATLRKKDEKDDYSSTRHGERILWSHEDADQHDDYYRQLKQPPDDSTGANHHHHHHQDDDDNDQDEEEKMGFFQMNSNTSANVQSAWRRLDKHTIVSSDGKQIRTKHDVQLNKQLNADKLYNIEGSYSSQQKLNMDHNTYQSFVKDLKKQWGTVKGVAAAGHGRAENMKASQTRGGAMDGNVRIIITKAINAGTITTCHGVVKEGKEALVYYAQPNIAVKVFKRITEFRNRMDYVQGDPRFATSAAAAGKKTNKRQLLEQWTEKEYRNLRRAIRAGVPVPQPLQFKENVLFLQFLGNEDGWPCPQLKEVKMNSKRKWTHLYQQTLVSIRLLYHGAKLIHGDLSEYNILLCPSNIIRHNNNKQDDGDTALNSQPTTTKQDESNDGLRIALIDFGQAVDIHHPASHNLLERDCENIRSFFHNQQNIPTLTLEEQLDYILQPPNSMDEEEEEEEDQEEEEEEEEEEDQKGTDEDENNDSKMKRRLHRHTIPGWNHNEEMNKIELLLQSKKKIVHMVN